MSSNSVAVTFDLSRMTKTRLALARVCTFLASSVLVPPVVVALAPSDQTTAIALAVRVVAADAQAILVAPVAVLQTLSRFVLRMLDIRAVLMPLVRVNGNVMPLTVVDETA